MFSFGPLELVVILVIVVLVFGVGRLPELGTGLGEGIRNFKKSYRDSKAIDITEDEKDSSTESSEKKD